MGPIAAVNNMSDRLNATTAEVAAASRRVSKDVAEAANKFTAGITESVGKLSKTAKTMTVAFIAVAIVAITALFMAFNTRKLVVR
jgi:predicted dinucleotide-binding enzyme